MKFFPALVSSVVLSSGMAAAQVDTTALVNDLQAQGYSRVEVRTGPSQVKVEAIRGTEKVETIYDSATGSVLKSETGTVGVFEKSAPGVSVRERNRDFVRVEGGTGSGKSGPRSGSDDDDDDNAPGSDDRSDDDSSADSDDSGDDNASAGSDDSRDDDSSADSDDGRDDDSSADSDDSSDDSASGSDSDSDDDRDDDDHGGKGGKGGKGKDGKGDKDGSDD